MKYKQFKFYRSYFEAISQLDEKDQLKAYDSICSYALNDEEKTLNGNAEIVFTLIKPIIDSGKYNKGENHWNWKGGITSENARERHSKKYSDWRENVFIRDNYTCQICGKHGVKLNAHHKKKWSKYPELRYDVNNGITLCEDCHKDIHKKH